MQQEYYVGSHEYPKKAAQNYTEEEAFGVQLALMFFSDIFIFAEKDFEKWKISVSKKICKNFFFNILCSRDKIDKLIIRRF